MGSPSIFDLYVRGLRISRRIPQDSYLSNLPAVRCLQEPNELALSKRVAFLVGENGVGKSTLMEALAIAMGFNPEGGTINFRFSTADSHSELYRYLTVIKGASRRQDGFFLRAESFYNLASEIDRMDREPSLGGRVIDSYGGVSLHRQSHGESFLSLIENRFGGARSVSSRRAGGRSFPHEADVADLPDPPSGRRGVSVYYLHALSYFDGDS